jgi:hypothetical protein
VACIVNAEEVEDKSPGTGPVKKMTPWFGVFSDPGSSGGGGGDFGGTYPSLVTNMPPVSCSEIGVSGTVHLTSLTVVEVGADSSEDSIRFFGVIPSSGHRSDASWRDPHFFGGFGAIFGGTYPS